MDANEAAGSSLINSTSTVATLLIAITGLIISFIALRLTREQARTYLYPVPGIYGDPDRHGIVLRNFGSGAMMNVWADAYLSNASGADVHVSRHLPSLGQGEQVVLLEEAILRPLALLGIRVVIRYDNIKRQRLENDVELNAGQLGPLGF